MIIEHMHTYTSTHLPTYLVRKRPRDDVAGGAEARQQEDHQRVAHQGHLVVSMSIGGWA